MISQSYHFIKKKFYQKKSIEDLKGIQLRKLKSLLNHANSYVPYYRDLFEKINLSVDTFENLDELNKIPILTKEELRDKHNLFISEAFNKNKIISYHTSGSSGIPLEILSTRRAINISRAQKFHLYSLYGYKLNWKIFRLSLNRSVTPKFHSKLGLHKEYNLSPDLPSGKQIEIINSIKPEVFDGLPGRLEQLIDFAKENSLEINKPKLIFTNSEMLDNITLDKIINMFGTKPNNYYTTREAPLLAWQCNQHNGFHINIESYFVELRKENESDDSGEVIITNLENKAMPLIRYNLGDIASLEFSPCDCGTKSYKLKNLIGRSADFMILPSGKKVSGLTVLGLSLKSYSQILQFRGTQKKDGSLLIEVVLKNGQSFPESKIINDISTRFENIKVYIVVKDTIENDSTIKLRKFKSELFNNR